ncbi:hypothetical protein LZC95_37655 [Pendulispora brunnea]|uniref:Aminopeptidase N n=1 Tax=Pendulispora brunnea TaxID=2905690 RepID=A0ABZ2K487_9BACT
MKTVLFRTAVVSAVGLFLWNCGDDSPGSKPPPGDAGPDANVTPDAGDAGTCSGCTGTRDYDAKSYALRARYDWTKQRLIAEEDVSLTLTKTNTVVALDANVEVKGVTAKGTDVPWAYDSTQKVLHVNLAQVPAEQGAITFVVKYEAPLSRSLFASKGRDGDPVTSRVVFTSSEPDRARNWLVSNDHPSDRALWSAELTVADDEDVISNGERVKDEKKDGSRTVGYRIATPLPTYLMAFAGGQLEHKDRAATATHKPLSVWYRKGLVLDTEAHLSLLAELMETFGKLVGEYPFDRYSVVLLPEFGGGMENATITFNQESSGQGTVGFGLNAHELAHHWFGDWVTMHTYDDVWFKEGMATLLASEAERQHRETGESKNVRLFGRTFGFDPADAIVDKSLTGSAKYTDGPYGRAAWTITQIRARVGEDAFWGSLKGILQAHPAGTLTGEQFVRGFAPKLDDAAITKILATLEKKEPPGVAIEAPAVGDAGTAGDVKLTLSDPSAALLDPIDIVVVDKDGNVGETKKLTPGTPLTVNLPEGSYLVYDPREVHPSWDDSFTVNPTEYYGALSPRMVPMTEGARKQFTAGSSAVQERILLEQQASPAPFEPSAMPSFYDGLDSRSAKFTAEVAGCQWLSRATDKGPWTAALTGIVTKPALNSYNTRLALCGSETPQVWFDGELEGTIDAKNAGRKNYLLSFDYGPTKSFTFASNLAANAPSLLLRDQAVSRLASQAAAERYSKVPDADVPAWQKFFRDHIAETTTQGRLLNVWKGIAALSDHTALAAVGGKLQSVPLSAANQRKIVCEANKVAGSHGDAWEAFRNAAKPWEKLAPDASTALQDPSKCQTTVTAAPEHSRAPQHDAVALERDLR